MLHNISDKVRLIVALVATFIAGILLSAVTTNNIVAQMTKSAGYSESILFMWFDFAFLALGAAAAWPSLNKSR